MTNLDSMLKSRDITFPTKVHLVKAVCFPVVMYRCERWTIKKAERWRSDAFKLWCWRRLVRVPWTARRSNQSILKGINPEYSLKGRMLKLKLQYFGHLLQGASSLKKMLQFSSVAQLFPTPCDPMNCSTLGLPVHHQLPEPTQTHVHWVGDAIQPSHPLSSPSPPAFNLSQHQGLFKWVSSLHHVAKVLEFQLQHQSFLMLGNMKAKGENHGVVPTVCSTGLLLVLEGPGPETRQIYTKDRQKENTGIEESDVLNLSLKGSIAGRLEGMIYLRKS